MEYPTGFFVKGWRFGIVTRADEANIVITESSPLGQRPAVTFTMPEATFLSLLKVTTDSDLELFYRQNPGPVLMGTVSPELPPRTEPPMFIALSEPPLN